jgi:sarcosine oxidase
MPEAYRAWRELEADAAVPLLIRTGGVSFGPHGSDYVARVAANLDALAVPHRRLDGAGLHQAMPAFVVPGSYDVVFEPDAGLLAAALAQAAELELARRHAGDRLRVLENCPIRRLDLEADRPTLVGDRVRVVADRLIVAAGAWAGTLLPGLADRLRPTRQQVLYLQPKLVAPFLIGRLPVFIAMGGDPREAYYGMPSFLGGGVKVARHGGPTTDPDAVDRSIDPAYVEEVRGFLRGHLPALADAPVVRGEVCLYTMAPGEEFIVGPLPGRPDVIVASPCSGHGFKFSPLIGRVLAELATEGTTPLDVASWCPRPEAVG